MAAQSWHQPESWHTVTTAAGTFVPYHPGHSEYLRGRFGAGSCRRARIERPALNDAKQTFSHWGAGSRDLKKMDAL